MALQLGDKIPNFSAKDNNGNDFESASIVSKRLDFRAK